jgi:hypothetical protein
VPEALISEATFYKWGSLYGGMKISDARPQAQEAPNGRTGLARKTLQNKHKISFSAAWVLARFETT